MKTVLECAGHSVLSVNSFYKAKALLFAHACDVILTDVHLENGGTAFDFLKWVKLDPLLGSIPFILMDLMPKELARYLRDGMRIAARELGAIKYISMNQFDPVVFIAEFSEFRPRQNIVGFDRASKAIESNRAKLALDCLKLFDQRDRFVAMLAHDFRTPLVGSERVIGLMLEGASGTISDPQTTLLTALSNTNKALLLMIANVVETFQRDTGDTICLTYIDLAAVVAERTQSMEPVAAGKKVRLITSLKCEKLVWADAPAMRRVISNLLSNAIKFTPAGGVIEVLLEHSQLEAVLVIRDNGIGMDSGQLTHLFEEFSQAERAGGASGFGLGLHVCKYLLGVQNATIECVSELNFGTTFSITLPLSSRNSRALIVEGDCEHRVALKRYLESPFNANYGRKQWT